MLVLVGLIIGLAAESRGHLLPESRDGQSVAADVDVQRHFLLQVAGRLQGGVAGIDDIGHQVDAAVVGIVVIVVQLDEINVQQVGEQLLHGGRLGVLPDAGSDTHKRRLSEHPQLREVVAHIDARVEVGLAVHGVGLVQIQHRGGADAGGQF